MNNRVIIYCIVSLMASLLAFQNCSQGRFTSQSEISSSLEQVVSDINLDKVNRRTLPDNIIVCPMVMCAAPPEGCSYQQENPAVRDRFGRQKSCSFGCGKLVCPDKPKFCPMIACARPEPGCTYKKSNKPVVDKDGCDLNCGDIVCDQKPKVCDVAIKCAAPPDGCKYVNPQMDASGCQVGCGALKCELINRGPIGEKPPISIGLPKACPMIACAEPPNNCKYAGSRKLVDGCVMDCGQLVCDIEAPPVLPNPKKVKPEIIACPDVSYVCMDGGPNCRYDTAQSVDANGCQIGCGKMICADDK